MLGLVYTATFDNVTVSALQDLITITAPSDAAVVILEGELSQQNDYGDAEAEGLRITLNRYATAGSGGSSVTPRPHHVGFPAAGSTVTRNNTSLGGTATLLVSRNWNIQMPLFHIPIPETRWTISPSGVFAITLPAAPTPDAIIMSGWITFVEIGG